MIDILLINPPFTLKQNTSKVEMFMGEIEPLGLLYLASSLKKAGFTVNVIDALVEKRNLASILSTIESLSPKYIGLTCVTATGLVVYKIAQAIKSRYPAIKILLGNQHASYYSDFYLKSGFVDFVFHGEAEHSVVQLLNAFKCNMSLKEIKGFSYLEDGNIVGNKSKIYLDRVDDLPFPARELIPMEQYGKVKTSNNIHVSKGDKYSRFMYASRGCIFKCTFCVVQDQHKIRFREPKDVVDEMEMLVEKYNADHITFLDSLFVGKKSWVYNVCNEILERKLKVSWAIEGHINIVDKELLIKLKEAGCSGIYYGIESGNDIVLKKIKKNTNVKKIREIVELTKNLGLKVIGYFMLGLPGDTKDSMDDTINFAKSLPLDLAQFGLTVPYPGSEIFADLIKSGKFDPNINSEKEMKLWERFSPHSIFTGAMPIYLPDGLTKEDLIHFQKKAIRSYYLRPKEILRYLSRIDIKNIKSLLFAVRKLF